MALRICTVAREHPNPYASPLQTQPRPRPAGEPSVWRGALLRSRCAAGLQSGLLRAAGQARGEQSNLPPSRQPPSRPDVAAIDHDRILAAAERYLTQPPTPLTSLQCPRSPGTVHDYYSEAGPPMAEGESPHTAILRGRQPNRARSATAVHRAPRCPVYAGIVRACACRGAPAHWRRPLRRARRAQLRAWFVDPATRMTPRLDFGQVVARANPRPARQQAARFAGHPGNAAAGRDRPGHPFLAASALSEADRIALHAWFASYLRWLTETAGQRPASARVWRATARTTTEPRGCCRPAPTPCWPRP